MPQLSRRAFSGGLLGGLLTYSLLETLVTRDLFADEMRVLANDWMKDLQALGQDLKGKKLSQTDWQGKVDQLFEKVDLADALQFINFEKLTAGIKFPSEGERSLRATFPKVEGLPTDLIFGHQVFALAKGRSVVPHGHNNMATAFLILQGGFQGRHFDRLEEENDFMVIRPTIDRAFKPGDHSTVSDHKDNVHWFTATTETAFIFNIHVNGIDADTQKRTGRVYIDPMGEKLSGDRIKARKISSEEVYKKFG